MLFSRMVDFPSRLNTAMASTAMGIEADTVSPARSARYTVEAPKISPKIAPRMMARRENSAGACDAGTNGWNGFAGAVMTSPGFRRRAILARFPLEGKGGNIPLRHSQREIPFMVPAVDRSYITRTLQDLVRINSINPSLESGGPGEAEIAAYVARALGASGLEAATHEPQRGRVSVVGRLDGQAGGRSRGRVVMLNAHMDT